MRLTLFGLILLSLPAFALEAENLQNLREGTSFYNKNTHQRSISRALKQVDSTKIISAFDEALGETDENNLCSFDLNASLDRKLKEFNTNFTETEGAILYLRSQDQIDDVVTKILLTANAVSTYELTLPEESSRIKPSENESFGPIKNFTRKTLCFDEAYRSLHGELKTSDLELVLYSAYEQRLISFELYRKLEGARSLKLESSSLTLKTYYKKVRSLRTQFPIEAQKSNFVTKTSNDKTLSRRQKLLENYSDLQIMLMAGVVKKLRARLEATKAEILIYDRGNTVETITLEPMERFRLAIKLLRKEMALLSLSTFFAGRTPDYMDLMSAAYEVGIIAAEELEEVAGLEDMWNPKKTFWEKARVWVRLFSSAATVAIPAPYGFVPALALVVIEMSVDKNEKTEDPTVLF